MLSPQSVVAPSGERKQRLKAGTVAPSGERKQRLKAGTVLFAG